jgi:hypothetical protein
VRIKATDLFIAIVHYWLFGEGKEDTIDDYDEYNCH